MAPSRRRWQLAAVAALITAAGTGAGCTASGSADRTPGPSTPDHTAASPTSPPVEVDGDSVVWQELRTTAAELDPPVPVVTIYQDGRAFLSRSDDGGTESVAVGTVDREDLDQLLSDAVDSGLFEPGTDFGGPDPRSAVVLDLTARLGGVLRTTSVSDPDAGPADLPPGTELTEAQVARRSELHVLIERAADLATGLRPWTPDRVRARAVTGLGSELTDPGSTDLLDPQPWPGPSFDAFPDPDELGTSCLVIEGEDAASVYRAAFDNLAGFWTEGDELWPIVVDPLLPGQEGCGPR